MAIDLKGETIIDAFRESPSYLGAGRNGKPPHKSFVLRTIMKGLNGHRLEALRVGSRWITSVEAPQRRAEAQSVDATRRPVESPAIGRRKEAERASRELDRLGF